MTSLIRKLITYNKKMNKITQKCFKRNCKGLSTGTPKEKLTIDRENSFTLAKNIDHSFYLISILTKNY